MVTSALQLGFDGIAVPPEGDDFISTPEVVTKLKLRFCPPPMDAPIVDPGAGGGAILQVLKEEGYRDLHAVEIREIERPLLERILPEDRVRIESWYDSPLRLRPDVVIDGNPPFSQLPAFAEACFNVRRRYVALLMPIDEIAGKQVTSRFLHRVRMPTDLIPLPWRIWGGVRGVAWYVWQEQFWDREGTIIHDVLAQPAEEGR